MTKAKLIALAVAATLIIWPGIPLAKFYGPFIVVYLVNGPGR